MLVYGKELKNKTYCMLNNEDEEKKQYYSGNRLEGCSGLAKLSRVNYGDIHL